MSLLTEIDENTDQGERPVWAYVFYAKKQQARRATHPLQGWHGYRQRNVSPSGLEFR